MNIEESIKLLRALAEIGLACKTWWEGRRRRDRTVDLSRTVWRNSTQCHPEGCVEVACIDGHVAVRDSKDPDGPVLVFTRFEWEAFILGVREGKFDRLEVGLAASFTGIGVNGAAVLAAKRAGRDGLSPSTSASLRALGRCHDVAVNR